MRWNTSDKRGDDACRQKGHVEWADMTAFSHINQKIGACEHSSEAIHAIMMVLLFSIAAATNHAYVDARCRQSTALTMLVARTF
jgi:hypothetical protein